MKNTIQTSIPEIIQDEHKQDCKLKITKFKLRHIFMATILAPFLLWILASILPNLHTYEGGSIYSGEVYNWQLKHDQIVQTVLIAKQEECNSEKEGAVAKLKANAFDSINNPLDDATMLSLKHKRDSLDCGKPVTF